MKIPKAWTSTVIITTGRGKEKRVVSESVYINPLCPFLPVNIISHDDLMNGPFRENLIAFMTEEEHIALSNSDVDYIDATKRVKASFKKFMKG